MKLTNFERKAVFAFLSATANVIPEKSLKEKLIEYLERHLDYVRWFYAYSWRAILILGELLPVFRFGKLFSNLSESDRDRVESWYRERKFLLTLGVRRFLETIIVMNYYSIPEVSKKLGYNPEFGVPKSRMDFPSENDIEYLKDDDEFDVIVIGSGAGGSVAAWRLAKKGLKVLILEEGKFFSDVDYGKDPITAIIEMYRYGGVTPATGNPFILIPEGKCVGGTTTINSGTCFRAPEFLLREWMELYGLSFWSPEKMAPVYEEIEDILKVTVASESVQSKSAKIFEKGFDKLGYKLHPLMRNAPLCKGSGTCCFGCPVSAKLSADLTFVPLALLEGAKLLSETRAEKIIWEHHRATGVLVKLRNGKKISLRAKEIVVAAGTINTPRLLMRSKLPHLSNQVGRNLSLHPASKVMALFDESVEGWNGIPQGYFNNDFENEGIVFEGIFLPPGMIAPTLLVNGKEHKCVMDNVKNLAIFGLMIHDKSRGRVLSSVPFVRYDLNKADLAKFKKGIEIIASAFFEAGAKEIFLPIHSLPILKKEEGLTKLKNLKLSATRLDLQAFHPLGTCRMGADPKEAVIDPYGRLYGVENVYVADASIFPSPLGVNPMLTIMAASYRIADQIAEHL